MSWFQRSLQLPPFARGCHLITDRIEQVLAEMPHIEIGWLHLFLQHTSASLSLNENADPDVRRDMALALDRIVPENMPFAHTCEGPDDMPAHVKSSMMGVSLLLPISNGRLALGTWQGIYLSEHRNHGGSRRLLLTLQGLVPAAPNS